MYSIVKNNSLIDVYKEKLYSLLHSLYMYLPTVYILYLILFILYAI